MEAKQQLPPLQRIIQSQLEVAEHLQCLVEIFIQVVILQPLGTGILACSGTSGTVTMTAGGSLGGAKRSKNFL